LNGIEGVSSRIGGGEPSVAGGWAKLAGGWARLAGGLVSVLDVELVGRWPRVDEAGGLGADVVDDASPASSAAVLLSAFDYCSSQPTETRTF
jgi:hypothetical protein